MLGDLRSHGRHGGEEQTDRRHRRSEGERAFQRQPGTGHAERDQYADQHIGDQGDEQRGRDRRVAPHGGGAHQLGPAALLLRSRVPGDEEDVHQGDHDERERAHLEDGPTAERLQADRRTVHGDDGGVLADQRGGGGEVGVGRVQPLHARRRRDDEQADSGEPQDQTHAVAPQDQAYQRTRARELGHRSPAGVVVGDLHRQLLAVVAEEQLLQRRRMARQRRDTQPGQMADGGADLARFDVERDVVVGDDDVVHAR